MFNKCTEERATKAAKLMAGMDLRAATDSEASALADEQGLTLQTHSDLKFAGASVYVGLRWDAERDGDCG